MKKLTAIILTLTMAAALSACSDSGSDRSERRDRDRSERTEDIDRTDRDDSTYSSAASQKTEVSDKAFTLDDTPGTYTGDWENDMPNGNGRFDSEVCYYSGEWVNGVPHGKGELFYEEGSQKAYYNGDFSNGKMQGYGYAEAHGLWEDSGVGFVTEYLGEVNNGMSGKGVLTIRTESNEYSCVYEGEFRNNDCYGKMKYQKYENGVLTESGIYENGKYTTDEEIIVNKAIDETLRYLANKEGLGGLYDVMAPYFFG